MPHETGGSRKLLAEPGAHRETGRVPLCDRRCSRCSSKGGRRTRLATAARPRRGNSRGGSICTARLALQVVGSGASRQKQSRLEDAIRRCLPAERGWLTPSMAEGAEAYFEDHKASPDLGRLALRGGIVSVAMQYGNGALQIVAAIVLARLLAPEDFGLVAIVTVLTSFAPLLIDFGLGDATAQRSRITQSQVSSLFWFSTAVGVAVAAVVAACSPLIATIYRDPRLEPIALCSAVTFVLWGLSNLHLALLRRTMQFGTIAGLQVTGTLAGIVIALFMALCGYGYWALVLRPIASALYVTVGAWLLCRWRPGFPVFDDEVKSMVRFGLHVVGFGVTYTLAKAVDRRSEERR